MQGLYDEKWGENFALFSLVAGAALVLCPVVPEVGCAGVPIILELFLRIAAPQPPKTHVHGFGLARQKIVGDNTKGGAVVHLDWDWGLQVAHFLRDGAAGDCFTCVDVERTEFGFCRQGHGKFDDLGDIENGAAVGCFVGAVGEEKVSAGTASSFWLAEIGCITLDAKDHVAFGVGEDHVRMGGDVVKEVMGLLHGVFSGCGLGRGK